MYCPIRDQYVPMLAPPQQANQVNQVITPNKRGRGLARICTCGCGQALPRTVLRDHAITRWKAAGILTPTELEFYEQKIWRERTNLIVPCVCGCKEKLTRREIKWHIFLRLLREGKLYEIEAKTLEELHKAEDNKVAIQDKRRAKKRFAKATAPGRIWQTTPVPVEEEGHSRDASVGNPKSTQLPEDQQNDGYDTDATVDDPNCPQSPKAPQKPAKKNKELVFVFYNPHSK
ncbi:hypothetical protein HYFRA_00007215 [Hymenoscyphus fraxineus]|uniref:Uncharacterized protein n=1 Tax=Hymenoscyphus fraxineus TaxID=746836 RepID=A0A9N9KWK4_9HELO|nr:hypothetical protein HYFRA_00007215 [Hymenoscyphus fraxineus]